MISKLEEKFNEQHILAYDGSVVINNHIHRGYINWPLDGDHFICSSPKVYKSVLKSVKPYFYPLR